MVGHFGHSGVITFYTFNSSDPTNLLKRESSFIITDPTGTYIAFDETYIEDKEMFLITGLYTHKILGWYPVTTNHIGIMTTTP